tara:strand:- start:534 stop:965 length:432 start_codon:yes stop_codon:yes gene_type:complete
MGASGTQDFRALRLWQSSRQWRAVPWSCTEGGDWAGWSWGGGDAHDADAGTDTDTSPAVTATTAATAATTAAVLLRPALRTSLSGGLSTGFEVTGLSHEHDTAGDRTTGCYAADGSRRTGEPELVGGKGCHDGGGGDTESLMC